MIEDDERVAGEFFPSVAFNRLCAARKSVALDPVNFFIHWGVPDQLADFEHWGRITESGESPDRSPGMFDRASNAVCMAGLGTRMRSVSDKPKALIPIQGRPMFDFVSRFFPSRERVIITTDAIAAEIGNDYAGDAYLIGDQTSSQFETLLRARPALIARKDFFLTACDAYGLFDAAAFAAFVERTRPAAVIFTFAPSLTQSKMSSNHTHVSIDGERVSAVHIKLRPNDQCSGLAGFFWVNDGALFAGLDQIPQTTGQETLVDHIFKSWVESGVDIAAYPVGDYVHLGTADELKEFFFWIHHRSVFEPALMPSDKHPSIARVSV